MKRQNDWRSNKDEDEENHSLSKKKHTSIDSILSKKLGYLVELREISEPEDPERRFRMEIPTGQYSRLNERGQTYFRLHDIDFEKSIDLAEIVGSIAIYANPISFFFKEPYKIDLDDIQKRLIAKTKTMKAAFADYSDVEGYIEGGSNTRGNFQFRIVLPPLTTFYTYEPNILVAMGFTLLPVLLNPELVIPEVGKKPYGYYNPSYNQVQVIESLVFPEEWRNKSVMALASTVPYPYEDPQGSSIRYNLISRYQFLINQIQLGDQEEEESFESVEEDQDEIQESVKEDQDEVQESETLEAEEEKPKTEEVQREKRSKTEFETFVASSSGRSRIVQNANLWIEKGCGADAELRNFFRDQLKAKNDWTLEFKDFVLTCLFDKVDSNNLKFGNDDDKLNATGNKLDRIREETCRMAVGIKLSSKLIRPGIWQDLNHEDWVEIITLLYSIYYKDPEEIKLILIENQLDTEDMGTTRHSRQTTDPEQGTQDPEQGTKDPEQGTQDPEQGTKDPEQGTKNPELNNKVVITEEEAEEVFLQSANIPEVGTASFYFQSKFPLFEFALKQFENESDENFLIRLGKFLNSFLKKVWLQKSFEFEVDTEAKTITLRNKETGATRRTDTRFYMTQSDANFQTRISLNTSNDRIKDKQINLEYITYGLIRQDRGGIADAKTLLQNMEHFDIVAGGGFVMRHHTGYTYKGNKEISRLATKRRSSKEIKYDPVHAPANDAEFTFRIYDDNGKTVTFPHSNMTIMFYIY